MNVLADVTQAVMRKVVALAPDGWVATFRSDPDGGEVAL